MPRKVCSRRLSMEPLEERQLLSVDMQSYAQAAAFQPPDPILEYVSYPSSITLGDSARIRVRLDDRASGSNDTVPRLKLSDRNRRLNSRFVCPA